MQMQLLVVVVVFFVVFFDKIRIVWLRGITKRLWIVTEYQLQYLSGGASISLLLVLGFSKDFGNNWQ